MHPKNSITSSPTQPALTVGHSFHAMNRSDSMLFAIQSGAPVLDALEFSACQICEVLEFIKVHCTDEGLSEPAAMLMIQQLVFAKETINACVNGLIKAESTGDAQ